MYTRCSRRRFSSSSSQPGDQQEPAGIPTLGGAGAPNSAPTFVGAPDGGPGAANGSLPTTMTRGLRVHRNVGGGRFLKLLIGFLIGISIGIFTKGKILNCDFLAGDQTDYFYGLVDDDSQHNEAVVQQPNRKLLLVGVMTAQKYLTTRVVATHRAWANSLAGDVIYFSSEGSALPNNPEIPIVALPGVDDSYPPQKKSFLMLKYMYDRYGNDYEWFMRADDDVFIKSAEISHFLRSLNSSVPHFIGQAGQGTKAELGLLALQPGDNFCMGGPGMVMSHVTLGMMNPHVSYCLKHLYSTHEDVEIGRCVHKFAGIPCTWAFEMQNLFFQNYMDSNGSYANPPIMEVRNALTLHPLKDHTYQYHMKKYQDSTKMSDLRHQSLHLRRDIAQMHHFLHNENEDVDPLGVPPSLNKYQPRSRDNVLEWEFITGKHIYSHTNRNPKRGFKKNFKTSIEHLRIQVMGIINKNARQRGRTIDFNEILYGYKRVNPLHSADYVLDLLLTYRKHKGHKMTVPVRRHAYLQQTFTEPQFLEVSSSYNITTSHKKLKTPPQVPRNNEADDKEVKQDQNEGQSQYVINKQEKVVNFILPLAGRFNTFLHFMHNFEEVVLKRGEAASLVVCLFTSDKEDRSEDTIAYVDGLKSRYPSYNLLVLRLPGSFSRGTGLSEGSKHFTPHSILFFVDVDIYLSKDSLHRIRASTVSGKQVYYPIVFSQYDPATICMDKQDCPPHSSEFEYDEDYGYWRAFGFGIVSLYKSDFVAVGGFNTQIAGWGKEDVDLYEAFLKRNMTIFRAPDPGLVHIYHPVFCDPDLDQAQYKMCLGSQVATYGSGPRLAQIAYEMPEILNKSGALQGGDDTEAAEAAGADLPAAAA